MTGAEFWPRRPLRLGGLALALVLGLLIFAAPATPPGSRGSSWYRGPAGYSAWYQSLQQQGIPIQRWQRPRADLLKQLEDAQATTVTGVKNPPAALETLLAVLP
ncbi:MAG TPA: DUF4350 domain-containing protein, partial [Leptolyngbyaceae cyanobacterium M65_K2018_010]|nr:DUF4350 domain-containing protein [Leptolyngbyaceae cyanobacterium M65_K2018_010]